MSTDVAERTFTVEEFHRMAEAGIFGPEDRLELLDGRIIEMAPIGSRHAACVKRLSLIFFERFGRRFTVGVQDPVQLDPHLQLVPDLSVSALREDYYAEVHPRPGEIHLVVEVADATVAYDRGVKIPRYGRAGIPEAWLVTLPARGVEIFRDPGADGYRKSISMTGDATIESRALPRLSVRVDEILP